MRNSKKQQLRQPLLGKSNKSKLFDNKTGQSSSIDNIGKPQFRLVDLNFNEAGHGPSDTGGFLLLTTKSV
jgi:hypothetical protein